METNIQEYRDNNFKVINSQFHYSSSDKVYRNMITDNLTGFFFNKGLHIYGSNIENKYDNVAFINDFLNDSFGVLFEGYTAFACDIFGNQFVFSSKGIELFNIETSDKVFISNNFSLWLTEIEKEKDYYFGLELLKEWEILNSNLSYNERLTPKIPFILNGEYECSNLYAGDLFKILSFNASIAKQIVNLPDGTSFKIVIN